MELTPRQVTVLRRVVEGHVETGVPVGSRWLAQSAELGAGPSTIRAELARLEELGLLRHPHTSAGRVPTDRGYRLYVDDLLSHGQLPVPPQEIELSEVRREIDDAMRSTSEQLSQVTNLLAIVSAPPIAATEIRHVEVLLLQPQMAMVVVITSTGGVSKRLVSYDSPVDPGLVSWAGSYLNEAVGGMRLGARMLSSKLAEPKLSAVESSFIATLAPVFLELEATAGDSLYVEGAARLFSEHRMHELSQLGDLMQLLERRVALLSVLRTALDDSRVTLLIGEENDTPELRSLSFVAAGYGVPGRRLGAVSVVGPLRMDYATAIVSVREAAAELSRFVAELYDE